MARHARSPQRDVAGPGGLPGPPLGPARGARCSVCPMILQAAAKKARQMFHKQAPSLRNLALDLGLVDGHTDYTRFIILARSRTGSNFLRGMLNSHPQVLTYGEIFRNDDQVDFAV